MIVNTATTVGEGGRDQNISEGPKVGHMGVREIGRGGGGAGLSPSHSVHRSRRRSGIGEPKLASGVPLRQREMGLGTMVSSTPLPAPSTRLSPSAHISGGVLCLRTPTPNYLQPECLLQSWAPSYLPCVPPGRWVVGSGGPESLTPRTSGSVERGTQPPHPRSINSPSSV